jgi:hypothetical protein
MTRFSSCGGAENSKNKFVQRKIPGKKFVQPLRQSTNSLEKKFVQRLTALKKSSCRDMRLKKKFVPQKC